MKINNKISDLAKNYQWFEQILYFEEVDSSNNLASSMSQYYPQGRIAFVAGTQKSGKGRLANTWISPKGNIYLSILLGSHSIPQNLSILSMLPAVAIIEALKPLGITSYIKWPNDIVIKDSNNKQLAYFGEYRKIGGILAETTFEVSGIKSAVIGIGINIAFNEQIAQTVAHAGFLEQIAKVDYFDVLSSVLLVIDSYLFNLEDKEKDIFNAYVTHCISLGRDVTFEHMGKKITGKAIAIKTSGALIINNNGEDFLVNAKEVHFV